MDDAQTAYPDEFEGQIEYVSPSQLSDMKKHIAYLEHKNKSLEDKIRLLEGKKEPFPYVKDYSDYGKTATQVNYGHGIWLKPQPYYGVQDTKNQSMKAKKRP